MKIEYEKDYFPLKGALLATVVCSVIFFAAGVFGRFTEIALEVATGTRAIQPLLDDFTPTVCITIIIGMYLFAFLLLNYLQGGFENGPFSLPYKLDYNYKKIPKQKTA